jgi:hypothetical protein
MDSSMFFESQSNNFDFEDNDSDDIDATSIFSR